MHLFGGVDEEEEEREGARDDGRAFQRKGIDALQQLVERRRIGLPTPPSAAGTTQAFDGLKCLVALQPADDGAESGREQTNVVVKRQVFGARLGGHGFRMRIAECGMLALQERSRQRSTPSGVARIRQLLPDAARARGGVDAHN